MGDAWKGDGTWEALLWEMFPEQWGSGPESQKCDAVLRPDFLLLDRRGKSLDE